MVLQKPTKLKVNPVSGETVPLKLNLNPVFGDPKISAKVEFLDAETFHFKIIFKKLVLHLSEGRVAEAIANRASIATAFFNLVNINFYK